MEQAEAACSLDLADSRECPERGLESWFSRDALGKSANLSEPPFPNHFNGDDSISTSQDYEEEVIN